MVRSVLCALPWGFLAIAEGLGTLASAEAQRPLIIGASFSNTGPPPPQLTYYPVAGRREGHRLAGGAGPGEAALSYAAVEPASVKEVRRLCLAVIAIVLWLGSGSIVEAQPPIRIGATLAQTGGFAAPGQNQLRGYQLCVKHMNEKAGVLGRKLELVT